MLNLKKPCPHCGKYGLFPDDDGEKCFYCTRIIYDLEPLTVLKRGPVKGFKKRE